MARQTSFAAGEIAPEMWGRTDLARYAHGARRLRDFYVNAMGNAVSRPSTLHQGYTRYFGDVTRTVRLVPFLFTGGDGEEQGLPLEFGHLYVRTPGGDVVTPYTSADLARLTWAQSGDILFLAHPSYPPQLLKRLAPTTWTLSPIDFSRPPPESGSGAARLVAPLPVADATHPAREWRWRVTTLVRGADGAVTESLPLDVTTSITLGGGYPTAPLASNEHALYPDMPIEVYWAAGAGLYGVPNYVVGWRVYRGRGGLYGYVGETTNTVFKDVGEAPDYTQQPPQARNPFDVKDASGAVVGHNYPVAVAFFANRLVFADAGGYLWASRVGDYYNFDKYDFALEDAELELELASRKRERTRWLLSLRQLLVGTSASLWAVGTGDGTLSLAAAVQSEVGSSAVGPLVVGDDVLFCRSKGTGVRALRFSQEGGGYASQDVSLLSRHLFEGHTLVDWCYQEDPEGLVWAVRDDGALLCLSHHPESEVSAWTLHTLTGAKVESICSVPAGDEDAVYLAVRRSGALTIERFASRRLALDEDGNVDPAEAFRLDAAVTVRGHAPGTALDGTLVGHLDGLGEVWAVSDGSVVGPLEVDGDTISIPAPEDGWGAVVHVGLRFDSELETLDPSTRGAAERHAPKAVRAVSLEVHQSRGAQVGDTSAPSGLLMGESETTLQEWQVRTVDVGYGVIPYVTGLVEFSAFSSWNTGGRVLVRQVDPLPLTITAVNREYTNGG